LLGRYPEKGISRRARLPLGLKLSSYSRKKLTWKGGTLQSSISHTVPPNSQHLPLPPLSLLLQLMSPGDDPLRIVSLRVFVVCSFGTTFVRDDANVATQAADGRRQPTASDGRRKERIKREKQRRSTRMTAVYRIKIVYVIFTLN
jgi:hypothetical protein